MHTRRKSTGLDILTKQLLMGSEVLYRYQAVLSAKGSVRGVGMPKFSKLIESFSYKPGYEFTLVHPEMAKIDGMTLNFGTPMSVLYLKAYAPDSTKPPHELILLQFQAAIPHYIEDLNRSGQLLYLKQIIEIFEKHETDEWLRVDGELVKNPHAAQE